MTITRVGAALTLLLLFTLHAFAAPLIQAIEFRWKEGDDPKWALPRYDDSAWKKTLIYSLPDPTGVMWLRTRIQLNPENKVQQHPLGVFVAALASNEIYWDGELIGRVGKPAATSAQEIPGPIQSHFVIPEHLAVPGEHVIALRSSAHLRHFDAASGYWAVMIGDYDTLLQNTRSTTWISLISLSGMIMAALFALILYLSDSKDPSYLLLSLIGFLSAGLLVAEAWRNLFGYTYNWHIFRLIIIHGLTTTVTLLFLTFMILRFPAKGAKVFIIAAIIGIAISWLLHGWNNKSSLMFFSGLFLSLIWTIRAAVKRIQGSSFASVGLGITLVILLWRTPLFADLSVYFAIDVLLLYLLISHALQMRAVRIEREEAKLKSARLEIELLKKHLQPHFLMNTLTALTEWMEEDASAAVDLVQSLAEEFRILTQISNQQLIPLKDEIRLCDSHLQIMSRRKGCDFELAAEGIDEQSHIPPAIFHTLVENAITHSRSSESRVRLRLKAEQEGFRYIRYTFEAPFSQSSPASPDLKEGTGFRYIRARLQESYGADWTFTAGPEGEIWRTEIRVPHSPSISG